MAGLAPLGLILAGGNSTRMGRDKALISWQGTPLLRRVYDSAAALCDRVYILTPRQTQYAPILPPTAQFIAEPRSPFSAPPGPLWAFLEGMKALETQIPLVSQDETWILLLSCDLPYLTPGYLQAGWQRVRGDLTSKRDLYPTAIASPIAYVPQNPEGWWEPLVGFYALSCRGILEDFLQRGGRSFQQWFAEVNENTPESGIVSLPLIDPQMVFNLNSPQCESTEED